MRPLITTPKATQLPTDPAAAASLSLRITCRFSSQPSLYSYREQRRGARNPIEGPDWQSVGKKLMTAINITSVQVLNNPASFGAPLQLEISYECHFSLQHGAPAAPETAQSKTIRLIASGSCH